MTLLWMSFWECVAVAWIYGKANSYYFNVVIIALRPYSKSKFELNLKKKSNSSDAKIFCVYLYLFFN